MFGIHILSKRKTAFTICNMLLANFINSTKKEFQGLILKNENSLSAPNCNKHIILPYTCITMCSHSELM